ncbi:hypothetical protein STSO111631_05885 [Stackebrandtia soli]
MAVALLASAAAVAWTLWRPLDAAVTRLDTLWLALTVLTGTGALVALLVARHAGRDDPLDRFERAAAQIASTAPMERLAGVCAMAALADEWHAGRQLCVDVLCGHLRMPYEPGDEDGPRTTRTGSEKEVRRTVLDIIGRRLRVDPVPGRTWHEHRFDFSGAVLDAGDLSGARFVSGTFDFARVTFTGFVRFDRSEFLGGAVSFADTTFRDGVVTFNQARFHIPVPFTWADFIGSTVYFDDTEFVDGTMTFLGTEFSGGSISFTRARFPAGSVAFPSTEFTGAAVSFDEARVDGGSISFEHSRFAGGVVSFERSAFAGGPVSFRGTTFEDGTVSFRGATFTDAWIALDMVEFTGGTVDARTAGAGGDGDVVRLALAYPEDDGGLTRLHLPGTPDDRRDD